MTSENQQPTATNPSEMLPHHPASQPEENKFSDICIVNASARLLIFLCFMQEVKAVKAQRGGYVRSCVPRRRTFSEL